MSAFGMQSAVIPITGAASGLGLAIARRLREEGATPLLLDNNERRLVAAGRDVFGADDAWRHTYIVDVRDSRAVDTCLSEIARSHGPVTHAVASAGTIGAANVLNLTDEQWHRVIDVNLHGAMYLCRAAARQLAERKKGSLVTIASIGGLSAREDRVSYVASKAAVINMTRALAVDLGGSGVRANAVAPGVIDTPMQDGNRGAFEAISRGIPLRRVGRADEIANAVLFLLSDFSSYVTGTTLVVDGGITAKYR